jgi:creatinine amidohydrolase
MPVRPLAGTDRVREFLAGRDVRPGRAGAHAGWTETSQVLACRPELVDMGSAAAGRADDEFYLPERIVASQLESFVKGIHAQAPNGVLGDPGGANAEDGETLLSMAAEDLARFLRA